MIAVVVHLVPRAARRALVAGGSLILRDYQLQGLNWMVYSWSQDRNVILADEVGRGEAGEVR